MTISFRHMVKSLEAADFVILISDGDRALADFVGFHDGNRPPGEEFRIGLATWPDIALFRDREYPRVSIQPGNMRGFIVAGVSIIPVKAGRA